LAVTHPERSNKPSIWNKPTANLSIEANEGFISMGG
jgi:hypothetical protein